MTQSASLLAHLTLQSQRSTMQNSSDLVSLFPTEAEYNYITLYSPIHYSTSTPSNVIKVFQLSSMMEQRQLPSLHTQ